MFFNPVSEKLINLWTKYEHLVYTKSYFVSKYQITDEKYDTIFNKKKFFNGQFDQLI